MAAVTICSDFGAQKVKSATVSPSVWYCIAQLKILCATTKTCCSQINIFLSILDLKKKTKLKILQPEETAIRRVVFFAFYYSAKSRWFIQVFTIYTHSKKLLEKVSQSNFGLILPNKWNLDLKRDSIQC